MPVPPLGFKELVSLNWIHLNCTEILSTYQRTGGPWLTLTRGQKSIFLTFIFNWFLCKWSKAWTKHWKKPWKTNNTTYSGRNYMLDGSAPQVVSAFASPLHQFLWKPAWQLLQMLVNEAQWIEITRLITTCKRGHAPAVSVALIGSVLSSTLEDLNTWST